MSICDMRSEKVPKPSNVNTEKIDKTPPNLNFDDFHFFTQRDTYHTKNVSCEFDIKKPMRCAVFSLFRLREHGSRHIVLQNTVRITSLCAKSCALPREANERLNSQF